MSDVRVFFKFGKDAARVEQVDDFFELFALDGRIRFADEDSPAQIAGFRRFDEGFETLRFVRYGAARPDEEKAARRGEFAFEGFGERDIAAHREAGEDEIVFVKLVSGAEVGELFDDFSAGGFVIGPE